MPMPENPANIITIHDLAAKRLVDEILADALQYQRDQEADAAMAKLCANDNRQRCRHVQGPDPSLFSDAVPVPV